jgi:CBS-domain-containing membrane protein
MTRDVVVTSLSESVATVHKRIRGRPFSALPVLDEHGRLVGSVTVASLTDAIDSSPIRTELALAVSISESAPLIDAIVDDERPRHLPLVRP